MTAPLFRQYELRDVLEAREREISQKITLLRKNGFSIHLTQIFTDTLSKPTR